MGGILFTTHWVFCTFISIWTPVVVKRDHSLLGGGQCLLDSLVIGSGVWL